MTWDELLNRIARNLADSFVTMDALREQDALIPWEEEGNAKHKPFYEAMDRNSDAIEKYRKDYRAAIEAQSTGIDPMSWKLGYTSPEPSRQYARCKKIKPGEADHLIRALKDWMDDE